MTKSKTAADAWIYINISLTLLVGILFGWKGALIEFLGMGVVANLIVFIRRRGKD